MPGAEMPWREWLRRYFPHATNKPFSPRHVRLWDWFEELTPGVKPRPRIAPWPRGGGKSTNGELGTTRCGVKLSRRFVLIVSETQAQSDERVQAIGSRFEYIGVNRLINKYGQAKGWRRDQLRTSNGFNVAGLGLDVGSRGFKLDDYRPDLIIFDDIDGRHDSETLINKKVEIITQTILPAGSSDCGVLFLQNLIHSDSIMSTLTDGRADFLMNRIAEKPEPAIYNIQYERVIDSEGAHYRITGGTASWEGQNIETCEAQFNEWGRRAFLREAQHDFEGDEDGLWNRERDINPFRLFDHPNLHRVGVAVDPSASSTGDEAGIMVGGVARIGGKLHGFLLHDKSITGSPLQWAQASVAAYKLNRATVMVAEANNGGEMVEVTIKTVEGAPQVKLIKASKGKLTRAEPIQKLCEDGRIHFIGHFKELEDELCNWQPGDPSPNRLDAFVWLFTELMLGDTASAGALQEMVVSTKADEGYKEGWAQEMVW